ncbi:uncharacterized protein LOC117520370 [Thalassophryne amazonica]|uniref:uncharacterized protein LOC117520370 n=1 Tax=Thalassophryne amazonica TaxID=390379 RepID=UPI0014718C52|nr:uncharacterized protein LOC117520370 [Thalassophryne amazonica]
MERSDDAEESSCSKIGPNISAQTEEKDWQQMLRLVMLLQKEGNFLIKQKCHEEASAKFKEALEYVDVLQNKVYPQSEDGEALERVRLPLTLNLSQCLLELQQYQEVVTLNDGVLTKHQGNFKAVYQRARAHAALCHEAEAQRDFAVVERLDASFKPFVCQELKKLGESMRAMHTRQNKTYWDASEEKWGPARSKAKTAVLKARKKKVKSAQQVNDEKAEMKEDDGETEEKETAEEPATRAEREENPDVKQDTSRNNETECGRSSGEGLDNENIERVAVQVDEQGAADNRESDTDSKAATTSTGKDNALSKRSSLAKARKKVKCQSPAALGVSETSWENDTGNGSTQSEQNNG